MRRARRFMERMAGCLQRSRCMAEKPEDDACKKTFRDGTAPVRHRMHRIDTVARYYRSGGLSKVSPFETAEGFTNERWAFFWRQLRP